MLDLYEIEFEELARMARNKTLLVRDHDYARIEDMVENTGECWIIVMYDSYFGHYTSLEPSVITVDYYAEAIDKAHCLDSEMLGGCKGNICFVYELWKVHDFVGCYRDDEDDLDRETRLGMTTVEALKVLKELRLAESFTAPAFSLDDWKTYVSPSYRRVEYLDYGQFGFTADFDKSTDCSLWLPVSECDYIEFCNYLEHVVEGFNSFGGDLSVIVTEPKDNPLSRESEVGVYMRFGFVRNNYAFYTQIRGYRRIPHLLHLYKEQNYIFWARTYLDIHCSEDVHKMADCRFFGKMTEGYVAAVMYSYWSQHSAKVGA